ncbi:MAG: hypothetical protein KF814_15825 [Nitrospiraceae bacterium]|nr:hypothetical protein [Nitrospiraceae bacterium]
MTWSIVPLHAALGGLVLAVGALLMWDQVPTALPLLVGAGAAGFLWWRSPDIGSVWAWTTMLMGVESMAWPVATMLIVRSTGTEPTEAQMGTILNAVLFGLFSSVFWVTFSLGLFKRLKERNQPPVPPATEPAPEQIRKKRARR